MNLKTKACAVGLILSAVLLSANNASAWTVSVKDYMHPASEGDRPFNSAYLAGAMDGLIAYVIFVGIGHGPMLFCLPPKLAMNPEQVEDTMLSWVMGQPEKDTEGLPVGSALLFALGEKYPCKK